MDRYERLDYADRWLGDGFRVLQRNPPGFSLFLRVDMGRTRELLGRLRQAGVHGSYAAILLRAAALALVRHPELHQIVLGSRRVWPERVDISLSVANEAAAAPMLRPEDVGRKPLPVLSEELRARVPEIREQDSRILRDLRRWGWLVPTRWLRRLVLRALFGMLRMRRRLAGSLQVTVVPNVETVVPYLTTAPALLSMGCVSDQVVAQNGQPVVRPMATLGITADHKVWDGARAATFLTEVGAILESVVLESELPVAAHTLNTAMTSVSMENR